MPQASNVVQFPGWAKGLFKPHRYKVLYGGRGSGKSYAVADALLLAGYAKPCRILCAREFQNSLSESVLYLLAERIEALGLAAFYDVQRETIIGRNGTTFIFKGVRNNVQSIKSMAGITHLWLEEAQTVSKSSWDVLIPTIREPGSEIWVTFNPYRREDPTYAMFVDSPPDGAYVRKVNWRDNPHWPETLEDERKRLLGKDPNLYAHVYEGECLDITDAQVFSGMFEMRDFKPGADWDGPYFGLDYGYALDETAGVQLWIHDRTLYVERELYRKKLELDDTAPALLAVMPDIAAHVVRCDNARPESISYIKRNGIPRATPCQKGKGSVEDGVAFIRSFDKVVIHSRCPATFNEFRLYSYKVDRLSGDVLPVLVDQWNHAIDAMRYALEPLMKNAKMPAIKVGFAF